MRSLADLGAGEPDTEDDDEHNEYYAGGEKSGQVRSRGPTEQSCLCWKLARKSDLVWIFESCIIQLHDI